MPDEYNSGTALVFWLGGIQDANENMIGFSADPSNPFDVDAGGALLPDAQKCASRIKPFFDFNRERITVWRATANRWCYWPSGAPLATADQDSGYVYFKANGTDYSTKGWNIAARGAMLDGNAAGTVYMAQQSFQIRCCGLDGMWWPVGSTAVRPWCISFGVDPGPPTMQVENYDDQVNFATGTLEDNIP